MKTSVQDFFSTVLAENGLIAQPLAMPTFRSGQDSVTLLRRTSGQHELLVSCFMDGTWIVRFVICSNRCHLSILCLRGKQWRVEVHPDFLHRRSPEQMQLWGRMPKRVDIEEGTFTDRNGKEAFRRLVAAFAALSTRGSAVEA